MSMSYNYPPQMAYPSAPPVYRGLPEPPRLHWGWVLALSVVTLGMFGVAWMVVIGWWVKRASGNARPLGWCIAYLAFIFLMYMSALGVGVAVGVMHRHELLAQGIAIVQLVTRLGNLVLYVVAAFTLKSALEEQPIDIPLSGVMTFLFAPIYFQYHLYDYSVEGRVGEQLSGFGEAVPPQV